MALFAMAVVATALTFSLRSESNGWIELAFVLSAAATISMVIWQACEPFADAAQWVGIRLKIPSSVRGATLDAVASSLPELFSGIFFVMVALSGQKSAAERLLESSHGYGSTIATCAGSSIYNMLLIPALCAIVISYVRRKSPHIQVEKDVIHRDGTWVIATQIGLLIFLFQSELHWWMGAAFLAAYAGYVLHLYIDTRRYRKRLQSGLETAPDEDSSTEFLFGFFEIQLNAVTSTIVLAVSATVAAIACYFLVELTNDSAQNLGVSPFFIAVILAAAVSSIPDTFVSLGSARRGDDSGAISNVFGSNIFDICIGMSLPLFVSIYLNDGQPITLDAVEGVVGLRVFLFVLTSVGMFILWKTKRVSRRTGWFFCSLYVVFIMYAVGGALDWF